ncbi:MULTISPECIES: NAD-dependent epimerase/dehydratase family protein [Streptomyces]|uniref:ADP-L-glycero-D-manno-heptose-6-epimerase n=1 Tax=Streptomyces canarius TaxID=285453 RepID=A0ABQ3CR66_9ACTN|nr:NAD-dependent epimerase/dehydratase family protein [Streptomyces canarius]GHA33989.1 ADP-L-glycero-D-manno-heptose-6-epimerase [Streptomyces canarius]
MPDEILITGTSGFIGRHCAIAFAHAGWRVTALDIRPAPEEVALCARVLRTDLADRRVLEEIRSGRFAAVVNQAGISSTVEQDRDLLQRVNVDAPVALAAACASSGTRFVYASSHSVYGTFPRGTLIAEDAGADRCSGPLNPYAESKLRLDQEMARASEHLNWVGLRYTNVFGSGEEQKGEMASILSQLLRQAAADVPVRLFADSLTASRDYVPVEVVARTCLALIDTPVPSGVYNLGSGAPVSFATLLEWSASFVQAPLAVQLVANPLSDRYQYWTGADLTKLRSVLPTLEHLDQDRIRRDARELFDEFRGGKP